ncbi:MAG: DsrE family protein [Betaproteobacteria bacterium]|nr:DsrE family protein [Betaproteobacteria bacterium]
MLVAALTIAGSAAANEAAAPYGSARLNTAQRPVLNTVFDVSYDDPQKLAILYDFIVHTKAVTRGKIVVVSHGPELKAFAKENYARYRVIVDKFATLTSQGVAFHMCGNALKVAGYAPQDMHGFITVVPSGFADIAYYEYKGYQYINPTPLSTKDIRQAE